MVHQANIVACMYERWSLVIDSIPCNAVGGDGASVIESAINSQNRQFMAYTAPGDTDCGQSAYLGTAGHSRRTLGQCRHDLNTV